jgi:hypothetical protein
LLIPLATDTVDIFLENNMRLETFYWPERNASKHASPGTNIGD